MLFRSPRPFQPCLAPSRQGDVEFRSRSMAGHGRENQIGPVQVEHKGRPSFERTAVGERNAGDANVARFRGDPGRGFRMRTSLAFWRRGLDLRRELMIYWSGARKAFSCHKFSFLASGGVSLPGRWCFNTNAVFVSKNIPSISRCFRTQVAVSA